MSEEILNKFKKFQSRSKAKFSGLYDRIEDDKKMLSGKQWNKRDDKFISRARNRITINVLSNQVHSVANSYSAFPFTWFTGEREIDGEIDNFFEKDSNRFASEEAVTNQVAFGLGVMALGSDTDASGNEVPVIYSVKDLKRVVLDPDSTELDGSDAMEGALVDYRSREWIRVHMGDQYLPGEDAKMIVADAGCSELVPIITYYVLDTDGCHVYTFVNDIEVKDYVTDENGEKVENLTVIPIHRIPIFPVWGEDTWDDDGKATYTGLVSKAEDVQRIVNYSFTQLGERLTQSPKAQWQGYAESFKGLDTYYKNAGTGNNPIIPANRLANDKKTVLELPKRLDNTVQFADVQGVVQNTLGMLSSITGVDSKGLADVETNVTATAAMYTAKVFQNNVRHYFTHLRTTFKAIGDTVLALLGHPDINVQVTQGPENYMELQIARQELTALMQVVEPNQKRFITNAILRTHPDNEILAQLYAELNAAPQPTPMEAEMQQTIEQMKAAIEQKDAEILQLTAQVETYQKSSEEMDKSLRAEFMKMKMSHEFKMEEMALQSQLQAGGDAVKAAAEADKAQLDLEQKAVQLETQKIKSAAEIAKTFTMPGWER